ncbi:GTP-binding protein Era [Entomoplasma freundtii]|uniref:GTPase Era n=2 Tax=Entomoplasma freundtii TaxID=74700 RepID=A0A2K8NS57_9MOLU|nr:GTPase Era [Entomoplasma freundtii]ATZ16386.1 GTP-binding protein Era [Entomoplasma freundtii]TDY56575.1 GTP-binding protein Era [Entomoplasma freundtii]
MSFKSGFVSVVGRPNVGKSSLVNNLIGTKVSIVTNKAQTTRNNIRGILTKEDDYQLIFMDTPGVHTPQKELDKVLNSTAFRSIKDSDVALFVVPANEKIGKNDLLLLKDLLKKDVPKVLLISKTDLVTPEELQTKIAEWATIAPELEQVITFNVGDDNSKANLIQALVDLVPESDYQFYPNGQHSDQSTRFLIKEILRENILFKAGQEVPHSVAILVDELQQTTTDINILATIIVERQSQKGIILGHQGDKIKDIKYKTRKELKRLFNKNIHLEVFVKVQENWRNSPSLLKKMGYDKDKY